MPADNLEHLLDRLLLLVTDTERFHTAIATRTVHEQSSNAVLAVLTEFRAMLNGIRNRVRAAAQQYVVAFVGAGNVGKSTLLNRLFGLDLAPRRNRPCTACPVEFRFGDDLSASVEYIQSLRKPVYRCDCVEDIHRRLTELADSDGSQSSESIRRICVTVPLPLLHNNGLVIADTPGFGAAQLQGAEGSHEKALKRYLEREVAQVFWIVLAEQGITKREIEFQKNVFGTRCNDIVVTGCENYESNDCERFRKRFISLFDARPPTFHFVSGKTGLGVDELAKRISSIDGRMGAAIDQIKSLALDLRNWVDQYKANHPYLHLTFWNQASWADWRNNFNGHELTGILNLDLSSQHRDLRLGETNNGF
jgi:GTP-binding protein EngB required for normal cell division